MFSVTSTSKSRGPADQVHRRRIDQHVLERHVRELGPHHTRGDLAPQARGLEDVGLVDRHQLAPPLAGELRRSPHDPLDFGDRVSAYVGSRVRIPTLLPEVNPSSELAHEHEVHALEDLRLESRRGEQGGMHLHRPQVGKHPERLAQGQQALLRPHLRLRRRPLGAADRPQQHGVRRQAFMQRAFRQRIATEVDGRAAERQLGENELVSLSLRHGAQAPHPLRHDLRADSIARQNRNPGLHAVAVPRCS